MTAATGGMLLVVGYFPPSSLGPGLSTGEVLDQVLPALLTCLLGALFIAHALTDGGISWLFRRQPRAPDFAAHQREVAFLRQRGKLDAALARCRLYLQQAPRETRGYQLALSVAEECDHGQTIEAVALAVADAPISRRDRQRLSAQLRRLQGA